MFSNFFQKTKKSLDEAIDDHHGNERPYGRALKLMFVDKNYEKAFKFMLMAAEGGDERAQFEVGVMLDNGRGCAQDHEKAMDFIVKSGKKGYIKAYIYLGGSLRQENPMTALKCYEFAANSGDVESMVDAGLLYIEVLKDYSQARRWISLAAEKGSARAESALALIGDSK